MTEKEYNALEKLHCNTDYLLKLEESRRQIDKGDAYTFTMDELLSMENMLAIKSPAMKRAALRLRKLSADEKAQELYEARLKEQRDNYAREQGAKKEGILLVATNALKMKMSIDDIIKLTGLTKEKITALQNADK